MELLVGMAILAIILGSIATSMNSAMRSYQYNMSQGRNVMSTREVLNAISDELRYATAISVATGTPVTILDGSTTVTYTVNSAARTISATVGTPATTYNLVINGRTISVNNLRSITFTRTAAKQLDISILENNASYTGSPTMTTVTTITMPNM